ncbi:hypothetical protein AB1N83_012799, partial [Pleurotus pulmonarius]
IQKRTPLLNIRREPLPHHPKHPHHAPHHRVRT